MIDEHLLIHVVIYWPPRRPTSIEVEHVCVSLYLNTLLYFLVVSLHHRHATYTVYRNTSKSA